MTLILLWVIILGILLLIYLALPLWSPQQTQPKADAMHSALQQLAVQREQSYSALVDLDEDYEVGKISNKDYQMLRQELLHETAGILNRIDTPSEKSLDDEIQEYKERRRLEEQ